MTPKEVTTLAHHRLVPPWAMKLVLEATSIEREKALEEAAKVCEEEAKSWARLNAQDEEGFGAIQCAAAIRGLK